MIYAKDVGGCPDCVNHTCVLLHRCERMRAQAIETRKGGDVKQAPSRSDESAVRKDAPR